MVSAEFGPTHLIVARPTVDAWRALALILSRHGYTIRKSDTGAYNCRAITGGTRPSLHAYGIAADINWRTNPRRETPDKRPVLFSEAATQEERALDVRFLRADTDMTKAMTDDALAIATKDRLRVFAWGGQFQSTKDAMHFQLDISPEELAQGIDWSALGASPEETPAAPQEINTSQAAGGGPERAREGQMAGVTSDVIAAAQAAQQKWGVPASVTLAQFILESNAGRSMPSGSNNPFGIKAVRGQPSVAALTHEVIGGRSVAVTANFRKFGSFDEAFEEHARLLATSHFYVAAMRVKDDPNKFADALTGVYATDPSYGSKLRRIMADHSLYQYDHFAPSSFPQAPGSLSPQSEQATPILVNTTAGGSAVASATLSLGSRGPQVTALQQALVKLGYHVGATDGIFGTLTRSALVAFQLDNNLDGSGVADAATWAAFDKAPSRPLDPSRTKATPADVGKLGSQTIRHADNTRMVGLISTILGALGIGNSTVVAATGGGSGGPQVPANLTEFVGSVQQLLANPALKGLNGVNHDELNKLIDMAKELQKTASSAVSPETLQILQQIRQLMPGELGQKYPDILKFLDMATTLHPTQGTVAHTVFDFLPGLFKAGGTPQIVSDGIAAVASSIIPGFGGSVAVLALGLAARYFGNQIIQARTRDHQDASNLAV